MIKALFTHISTLYKVGTQYYSSGRLPSSTWSRYFKSIDHLQVVTRGEKRNSKDGLTLSSCKNVSFDLLYEIKGGKDYFTKKGIIKKKLKKHIQSVDIVILRAPSAFATEGAKICKEYNKPYITEVVGCSWDSLWNYGNITGKILALRGDLNQKKVVKNSTASLYVTRYFLQNRYPSNAQITTYASNVEIPKTKKQVKTNHIANFKEKDEYKNYKIGQIGNIAIKYKGFDVALKALYFLKKQNPDFHFKFYMVGGGDSSFIKNVIEKYNLQKETEIVGRLESGEKGIFKFLDTLDLSIQPSKTEGLPRATIEAMSRACPVLASNAGGIPELISGKYLHNPGDHKKLTKDLVNILPDLDQRIEMAEENFKKAKEYTRPILSKRRKYFYKNAVKYIIDVKNEWK